MDKTTGMAMGSGVFYAASVRTRDQESFETLHWVDIDGVSTAGVSHRVL